MTLIIIFSVTLLVLFAAALEYRPLETGAVALDCAQLISFRTELIAPVNGSLVDVLPYIGLRLDRLSPNEQSSWLPSSLSFELVVEVNVSSSVVQYTHQLSLDSSNVTFIHVSLELPDGFVEPGLNSVCVSAWSNTATVIITSTRMCVAVFKSTIKHRNIREFISIIKGEEDYKFSYAFIGYPPCDLGAFSALRPLHLHVFPPIQAISTHLCEPALSEISYSHVSLNSRYQKISSTTTLRALSFQNTDFSIVFLDSLISDNTAKNLLDISRIIRAAVLRSRKAVYIMTLSNRTVWLDTQRILSAQNSLLKFQPFLFARDVGAASVLIAETDQVVPFLELYSLSTGIHFNSDLDIDDCLRLEVGEVSKVCKQRRGMRHGVSEENLHRVSSALGFANLSNTYLLTNTCISRELSPQSVDRGNALQLRVLLFKSADNIENLTGDNRDVKIVRIDESDYSDALKASMTTWRWMDAGITVFVSKKAIDNGVIFDWNTMRNYQNESVTRVILGIQSEGVHASNTSSQLYDDKEPSVYHIDHLFPMRESPYTLFAYPIPDGICFRKLILYA